MEAEQVHSPDHIVGVVVIPIGPFLQDNLLGILVAVFGAVPLLATSLTGFCPGYIPFGISTLGRNPNSIKSS